MSKYICITAGFGRQTNVFFLAADYASCFPSLLTRKQLFETVQRYGKHHKLHCFKLNNETSEKDLNYHTDCLDKFLSEVLKYTVKVELYDIYPINTYVLMYDELYFHKEPTEDQENFCLVKNIKHAFKFEGTEDEANALFKRVRKAISTIVVKLIS